MANYLVVLTPNIVVLQASWVLPTNLDVEMAILLVLYMKSKTCKADHILQRPSQDPCMKRDLFV